MSQTSQNWLNINGSDSFHLGFGESDLRIAQNYQRWAKIIKIYFLPYNLLKYLIYTLEKHKLDMIDKEIEILNKIQK